MVSFSGQQRAEILTALDDINTPMLDIRDKCFALTTNIDEMARFDLFGGDINPILQKPRAESKPFKPQNRQLIADISFWIGFCQFNLRQHFDTAELIDIPNNIYQNLITNLNQMLGWISMVDRSYFINDAISGYKTPCYQNVGYVYKDLFTGEPILPGQELTNYQRLGIGVKKEILILEPTADLNDTSILCKERDADNAFINSQVYFRIYPYKEKLDTVNQKINNILGILQLPTPEATQPITPVQLDSLGTRKLLQAILDFQTSVTITFQKLFGIANNIYGHVSFILLFLREDTKKDLQKIIEYTEDIIGGNPDEIGVSSLNQINYVWLQGSDGNYYPVPPIESTDPDNDVPLSRTNGILAGLKRADENARWRYRRVNDALFEIATNNNINKAFLEDLSPRIQIIETKVLEIQTKQLELEIKINEILTKVNTL